MLVEGQAVLARRNGQFVALPRLSAPSDFFPEDLRWWIEVPTAKLNGLKEGDLCMIRALAPRDGWSQGSPAGRLTYATGLRQVAQVESLLMQFAPSAFTSPVEESRLEDLLLRLPAKWAVFEIEGARPEQSGWHTRIHTLTPPDPTEMTNWLSGISPNLIQVVPWLTPVE